MLRVIDYVIRDWVAFVFTQSLTKSTDKFAYSHKCLIRREAIEQPRTAGALKPVLATVA
jgi:hypothetical protein